MNSPLRLPFLLLLWLAVVTAGLLAPASAHGARTWKIYGPDLSERYGGVQGTGGLQATVQETDRAATPVLQNAFGDVIGTITSGTVNWNAANASAYGVVSGTAPVFDGSGASLARATLWRGHRMDATGFYYLGARYYEPQSGRFISPDPLGHAASMSLYDYCNGDPVNGLDPDGRFGKGVAKEASLDYSAATSYYFWNSVDPTSSTADPFVRGITGANTASDWGSISVQYKGNASGAFTDTILGAGNSYQEASNASTQRMFYYHDELGRNWTSSLISASFSDPVLSGVGINGMLEGGYGTTSTGQQLNTADRWQRGLSGLSQTIFTGVGLRSSLSTPVTVNETALLQGHLDNAIARFAAKSSMTVLEEANGAINLSVNTSKGAVEIISNIAQEGETLTLSQLHIGGQEAGALGRAGINELKDAAAAFGAQRGASQVIIQGGVRTSGKLIGTTPKPIVIKVP